MKKVIRGIGLALGALLGLGVLAALGAYVRSGLSLSRTYDIPAVSVALPRDPAGLELGAHLAAVQCSDCHGQDLGGKEFFSDPAIGAVYSPNLTSGEGGAAAEMSDEELAAAIRHGVDHDGTGLMIMPSDAYFHLGDRDLGALIAHLRAAPPVDREWPESRLTFLGRVMVGLGMFGAVLPAEVIDHAAPRTPAPEPAVSVEYGAYLARISGCFICHGADLNGGKPPDPESPPAPNLTPGGHLSDWSEADFFRAMREGIEPDGEEIDTRFMNLQGIRQMTDDELRALWMYLHSLPGLEDAVGAAD